jgi:glycosyltransferase involved in cell wall biosynthesis
MRILLLAQWYEPIIGGEEVHVRSLAHALASRGHEVAVAALAHPDRAGIYADGPVEVHRLKASVQSLPLIYSDDARQSAPPLPDPALVRGLRGLVRAWRFDIVHAHNWMLYSYLPIRDSSIPLLLTLHDFSFICAKKVLLYRGGVCSGPGVVKCTGCVTEHYGIVKGPPTLAGLWAMHPFVRRQVDCVISVSEIVALRNGFDRRGARSTVIPNFLPDDFGSSSGDEAAPDGLPEEPFILFVGSLSHIKGVEVLVDAYSRLPQGSRPPLVLMGYTGSESLDVVRNPPPGVSVIVDQPRTAVAAACARSLFLVLPSIAAEAFGLVALEAMAMGRPVVASAVGGLPEVVRDGETGLLTRPGDADDLAAAMLSLVRDATRREALGRAARAWSAQFRESRVVPRIEQLYTRLLATRRAGTVPGSPMTRGPR